MLPGKGFNKIKRKLIIMRYRAKLFKMSVSVYPSNVANADIVKDLTLF